MADAFRNNLAVLQGQVATLSPIENLTLKSRSIAHYYIVAFASR